MPCLVPIWPPFLPSGEGVVRTREGWVHQPCAIRTAVCPSCPGGYLFTSIVLF